MATNLFQWSEEVSLKLSEYLLKTSDSDDKHISKLRNELRKLVSEWNYNYGGKKEESK